MVHPGWRRAFSEPHVGNGGLYTSGEGTNWITRNQTVGLSALAFGDGRFLGFGNANALESGVIGKLGAGLATGGALQGTLTGVTGQRFDVQISANLSAWSLLTNVTINTNGLAQFSDPSATNSSRRFYNAQMAPAR